MGKAAVEAVATAPATTLEHRPIGDVIPTSDNKRRIRKGTTAWKQFVESIKTSGVLEPLLARPHPKKAGKLDLRAGERRLRAAKEARLPTVPVIVRDMSDQEALEVTVTENLQRETLEPLAEGETISLLLDKGWEIEAIASHIGKSPSWIRRRANLTKLADGWKKELADDDSPVQDWSAAHLERVARLPDDIQEAIHTEWALVLRGRRPLDGMHNITLRELDVKLANWTRELKRAPFSLKDETLVPEEGACLECLARSSRQPSLFDELDGADPKAIAKADRCLSPACWEAKLSAWLDRRVAELKAKYPKLLLVAYNQTDRKDIVHERWKYHATSKGSKGAVPVLIVDGDGAGSLKWWALDDYYVRGPGANGGSSQTAGDKPKPKTLAQRQTVLNGRRFAWILNELRTKLDIRKRGLEDLHHEGHAAISSIDCLAVATRLAITFGTINTHTSGGGKRWKAYANLEKVTDVEGLATTLWHEVSEVLWHRLSYYNGADAIRKAVEIDGLCTLLGIDRAALDAGAEKAIPTPKSWANLKPDGTPKTAPKKKTAKKKAKASKVKKGEMQE